MVFMIGILSPSDRPALARPLRRDDTPDWSSETVRQFWDPGRKLLASIRTYQRWQMRGGWLSKAICSLQVPRHRFWSVVTGADIPLNARISGGLMLPHPQGIVLHAQAHVGSNCVIFQQVTIGGREGSAGFPDIGSDVSIGCGAKVLGGIRIGRHVTIGANAVVLTDIPDGATAVGVPARIINKPNAETQAN